MEGPKRGVSRTQVLRVYSAAEHRRLALEKAEALWDRMVDHLADRLEGPEREKVRTPEKVASAQSVDTNGLTLVGDMRALAQELRRERDAPAELVTALANISATLGVRVRATSDFRRVYLRTQQRRQGDDFGTGARLGALVEEEITELEKDVLYLESLLDRQKLEELQELAKQLANERRELARLIEEYKQNPDEQTREQVMQQIQEMRSRINELMQRMAELRQGIRDEHLNAEALQEMMKDQDMQSALDEVEKLMREGKTDEALAKLQELSMQMDEMLNGLDEAQDEFGDRAVPRAGAEVRPVHGRAAEDGAGAAARGRRHQGAARPGAAAEQGAAVRARQGDEGRAAASNRTGPEGLQAAPAGRAQQPGLPAPGGGAGRAGEREERAEGGRLRPRGRVDAAGLGGLAAARHVRASSSARWTRCPATPTEVRKQSTQLAEQLREGREVGGGREPQAAVALPAAGLADEPAGEAAAAAARPGAAGSWSRRPRACASRWRRWSRWRRSSARRPGSRWTRLAERMGEAAQRMQGKDANRGYGEQQAALEGLQAVPAADEGEPARPGQGARAAAAHGHRRPAGGQRERDPRDKVEIPDEDAYQAPKEFRKDLLDAMKQGAPEKYRDQVKRYYEELVK